MISEWSLVTSSSSPAVDDWCWDRKLSADVGLSVGLTAPRVMWLWAERRGPGRAGRIGWYSCGGPFMCIMPSDGGPCRPEGPRGPRAVQTADPWRNVNIMLALLISPGRPVTTGGPDSTPPPPPSSPLSVCYDPFSHHFLLFPSSLFLPLLAAIDLINNLLQVKMRKRYSVDKTLSHPWLQVRAPRSQSAASFIKSSLSLKRENIDRQLICNKAVKRFLVPASELWCSAFLRLSWQKMKRWVLSLCSGPSIGQKTQFENVINRLIVTESSRIICS